MHSPDKPVVFRTSDKLPPTSVLFVNEDKHVTDAEDGCVSQSYVVASYRQD